jgi:hypothetical protein
MRTVTKAAAASLFPPVGATPARLNPRRTSLEFVLKNQTKQRFERYRCL